MTITTEKVRALAERIAAHTDFDEPASESENRLILALAQDWLRMREALTKIAAFDDHPASDYLSGTGSYGAFDEPGSVEIARAALQPLSEKAET